MILFGNTPYFKLYTFQNCMFFDVIARFGATIMPGMI